MALSEAKPSILIVDEEGACRQGLTELLQGIGFEVVSATNYAEGARALQKVGQQFDFVILNIASSPRKGLEWLRQTSGARQRLGLFSDKVLCVASPFLDPQLELDFEYEGGKIVYEYQVRSSAA